VHRHVLHQPEAYYLTVPFEEFPKRFATYAHPTPRHMTVVPWFHVAFDHFQEFLVTVHDYCESQSEFEVTFGPTEMYGSDHTIPAQPVVVGKAKLMHLHMGLLGIVNQFGSVEDEKFCGPNYHPHTTVMADQCFMPNMPVGVWSVLAVAKYAKGEFRLDDTDRELSRGSRLGARRDRIA
jgi:2'-5' RNA ligase superfamily